MAQDGILGSHSLVISVWTGRCCLYPQETWVCQVSHKVKAKDPYNTAGHGNEFQVGCRGYSYLQHNLTSIWEAEGTWYPAFFADAGHHPPSMYGPAHVPEGPLHRSHSPDASEAPDLVQWCPCMWCNTNGKLLTNRIHYAQTISGLEGPSGAWLHHRAASGIFCNMRRRFWVQLPHQGDWARRSCWDKGVTAIRSTWRASASIPITWLKLFWLMSPFWFKQ